MLRPDDAPFAHLPKRIVDIKSVLRLVRLSLLGVVFAPLVFTGCNRSDPNTQPLAKNEISWFQDQTLEAGIDFRHERGPLRHWLPEIMGGGAAWLDFDADGDLDLYLIQGGDLENPGGKSNKLYRNLGNGRFEDATQQAGVGDTKYGMGAAVGDYNGDGHVDLYITNVGANVLYRNRGDGTFEDVSSLAGVGHDGWGTAATFVDYDRDGHLDLFLVNYIRWSPELEQDCRTGENVRDYCSPLTYQAPAPDVLFKNRGDGTFQDVSRSLGLAAAYGNGLGIVTADFNNDARIDFYVANDGTPNQLWLQNAKGQFVDQGLLLGCAVNRFGTPEAGMGVAAADLENDGDLDLFMTHLGTETNTLYVNQGTHFEDATAAFQLAAPSHQYTGFGLGFADFDNDTRLDLYVANGRVGRQRQGIVKSDVFAEPNQLFQGSDSGTFQEILPTGGTSTPLIENSRAAAFADFDNDGDVDVVVVNNGGHARLLENQVGDRNSWIRFRVMGTSTSEDVTGANVTINANGGQQSRLVGSAYGYLSSHEPFVHFGLGSSNRVEEVQVRWPDGETESFGPFDGKTNAILKRGDTGI